MNTRHLFRVLLLASIAGAIPASRCTAQTLELLVDPLSGKVSISNQSFGSAVAIDAYAIQSFSGSLNAASFAGFTAHGATGWTSAGPSAHLLSELNLTSSSTLPLGASYSLSNAFSPNATQDVSFSYTTPSSSAINTAAVVYTNTVQLRVIALLGNGGGTIESTASVLYNGTAAPLSVDGYAISSGSGSLHPSGFNGFAAHGVSGWQSVSPSSSVLSELNLTSASTLNSGGSQTLGSIFTISGSQDLKMTYSDPNSPALSSAMVLYSSQLAGDVNNDGVVNGLDIAAIASNWLSTSSPAGDANYDGVVNGLDIALVASHWLNTVSGGGGVSIAAAAVPEPASIFTCIVGALCLAHPLRRQRRQTR